MRFIGYLILVILLILGIMSIFSPRDFRLERSVIINKPPHAVFSEVKFLKNHDKWNAWFLKDPTMKKEYRGTDGAVGFVTSWESNDPEIGTAEQEITGLAEDKRMDTQIRFRKPFEASFSSYLIIDPEGENQTKVTMGMADTLPFPKNVASFIYNVCLGNQRKMEKRMDDGLSNLKNILEKQ